MRAAPLRRTAGALGAAVSLAAGLVAGPAWAGAATSTTSTTSTSSTLPASTVPGSTTTTVVPPTTAAAEIPRDEAQLLGLLDDVQNRLASLSTAITQLDQKITTNAVALRAATTALTEAQARSQALDQRVAELGAAMAAARLRMRSRAVLSYMHQPTGDLVNMLLKLSDPAELVDARNFYHTVIDAQLKTVREYDRLDRAARAAAGPADRAREAALQQQQAVASQQQVLTGLQKALLLIQQESTKQQADQRALLSTVGQDKAKFEAELAVLAEQSASITQLLLSLETPGESTASVTGGFFKSPIPGAPITQRFGPNVDPFTGMPGFHPGIDFGAKTGVPIRAAGDGIVVFAGEESGYGNYTCINHGHNVATCYAHQSAIVVKWGDTVKQGDVIGLVGSTGYSTGPHLHFEVRVNGTPVDPMPWLVQPPGTTTTTTP